MSHHSKTATMKISW